MFYRINIFFTFSSLMIFTYVSVNSFSKESNNIFWSASAMTFLFYILNFVSSAKIINHERQQQHLGYYIVAIAIGIGSIIVSLFIFHLLKKLDFYCVIAQLTVTGIIIFLQILYPIVWCFILTDQDIDAYDRYMNPQPFLEEDNPPLNLSIRLLSEENKENITGDCSICLEEFKKDTKIVKLSCGHIFHQDCIEKWTKKKKDCPICRSENMV